MLYIRHVIYIPMF